MAATTTETFVVRPDRATARRMMTLQGVVVVLIVVLGGARALTTSGWGTVASCVLYAVWLATIVWSLVVWRRIRRAEVLAEIGPQGIGVDTLGRRGFVRLGWDEIASVRKDLWGRIAVRPTRGRKLLIVVQPSDVAANQVLAAVRHFSGGRL